MDPQNVISQPQPPIPPVYPPQSPSRLPIKIGIVLLFIAAITGAYYLGIKQTSKQITSSTSSPTPRVILTPTTIIRPTQSLTISDETANWKTYSNQKLGISLKYPPNLYFKETDPNYGIQLAFEPFPTPIPGLIYDAISVYVDNYALYTYNNLLQAKDGETKTGEELHDAVGEMFTKLKNTKFGTYNAVEYIRDGITQGRNAPRGPIGYEHIFLIRKNDNEFIKLVNNSMEPDRTRQHDTIFNKIIASLVLQ